MKRTNESGRSMVEMLGVLAIIGVLSIGGIAGYSMAMNRYRANEALDMANKFAVVIYSSYHTASAMGNTWSAPTLASSGLIDSGTTTPGGATITFSDTTDSSNLKAGIVKLEIKLPTEGVCKAAQSILGIGESTSSSDSSGCTSSASCSNNGGSITYCFKQS